MSLINTGRFVSTLYGEDAKWLQGISTYWDVVSELEILRKATQLQTTAGHVETCITGDSRFVSSCKRSQSLGQLYQSPLLKMFTAESGQCLFLVHCTNALEQHGLEWHRLHRREDLCMYYIALFQASPSLSAFPVRLFVL